MAAATPSRAQSIADNLADIARERVAASGIIVTTTHKLMAEGKTPEEIQTHLADVRIMLHDLKEQYDKLEVQQAKLEAVLDKNEMAKDEAVHAELEAQAARLAAAHDTIKEQISMIDTLSAEEIQAPKRLRALTGGGTTISRSTKSVRFTDRIEAIKNLARHDMPLLDSLSFYGQWPDDLAVVPVDPTDPDPGMLARVKHFWGYMNREFAYCSGVYLGTAGILGRRFNLQRGTKRRVGEVVVMLELHEFPTEIASRLAEQRLNRLVRETNLPEFQREPHTGGNGGKMKGSGTACVYVLLVVANPKV